MSALQFQAISWISKDILRDPDEEYDKDYKIYIFGRTFDNKSICVKTKFYPYFYIEIPDNWKHEHALPLIKAIKKKLFNYQDHLVNYNIEKHKKYYGYTNHESFSFLKVVFKSKIAWSYAGKALKKNIMVYGKSEKYKIYEANLDPMIRFCHIQDIPFSCSIIVENYKESKNKISNCDIEIDTKYTNIVQDYTIDKIAPIVQASFDIETYSPDGSFPDPRNPCCPVLQIATTYQIYGEEKFEKQLFCVGECEDIPDVEVISCADERELLNAWALEINRRNIDTITGYNIWKFDLEYMFLRAEYSGADDFMTIGKLVDHEAFIRDASFSSSAYGDNHYKMVDTPGILQIDLLVIMQREHKLTSYKLDNVAEHFLGERKVDMPYQLMFEKIIGNAKDVHDVGVYCVQDTELPQKIINKLTILPNMVEMSKATWVPMSFLMERGQGIKVFSQLTRKTRDENMVVVTLTDEDKIEQDYEGATVLNAKKGAYMEIPITGLDFASLYPTIMRAHNLDHSTLVMDSKYEDISDVEYYKVNNYKFAQNHEGIIPKMLKELAQNRKAAKKIMAKAKENGDKFGEALANGRQLAFKVSMNSMYGFCGANVGMLPCKPVAESTTAIGRNMIEKTKNLVEEWYPGSEVVYGDSVMPYTPVLIKQNNIIYTRTIEELAQHWETYAGFLKKGTNKEKCDLEDIQTWTHEGWKTIVRVIRHKCSKKIYRISTPVGIVDVTEDHSLLSPEGKMIEPKKLVVGKTTLLQNFPNLENEIVHFPTCIKNDFFKIDHNDQHILQQYYMYYASLGYEKYLSLYILENGLYRLVYNTSPVQDYNYVNNVELIHECYDDYVYDLETSVGSFQAGIGKIIVKNTDSVMVKFNVGTLQGTDAIKKCFELGEEAANKISATFKNPIELEFEKVYYPYLLYSKKRYAGLMYTTPEKPDYIDAKGIQLVRRDNAPFVKDISKKVLHKIMYDMDIDGAMEMVKEIAKKLLYNKIPVKDLIVSKSMRDNYKNRNQPHLAVADKIEKRNPGSGPKSGERVPYIFIDTGNSKHKQFEKAEDPDYVILNELPIDVMYYLEHSLSSPLKSLFEVFVENPEHMLFNELLQEYETLKNKQIMISQFFGSFK